MPTDTGAFRSDQWFEWTDDRFGWIITASGTRVPGFLFRRQEGKHFDTVANDSEEHSVGRLGTQAHEFLAQIKGEFVVLGSKSVSLRHRLELAYLPIDLNEPLLRFRRRMVFRPPLRIPEDVGMRLFTDSHSNFIDVSREL